MVVVRQRLWFVGRLRVCHGTHHDRLKPSARQDELLASLPHCVNWADGRCLRGGSGGLARGVVSTCVALCGGRLACRIVTTWHATEYMSSAKMTSCVPAK